MIPFVNLGLDDGAKELLRKQPAVHQLCVGNGVLCEPVQFNESLFAVPLQPLSSDDQIDFLSKYARLVGARFDGQSVMQARLKSLLLSQIVSIVCIPNSGENPDDMEKSVRSRLDVALEIISCTTVHPFAPFAIFVHSRNGGGHFRLFQHPRSGSPSRIVSIQELETPSLLSAVFAKAEEDENFRFALTLLHDAVAESNPRFRIARLFNVLECFAAENKTDGLPSRKAVRFLLGFPVDGDVRIWTVDGNRYNFDIIELSGRLRDKLFHGIPFAREDLSEQIRPAFSLLEGAPYYIADTLTEYCKIALYNGLPAQRIS